MKKQYLRNSVKAIIIRDNHLLVNRNVIDDSVWFVLPGGGQEPGETFSETLTRECFEEISADVKMGELIFVREYIGANHEFAEYDGDVHQIEFMFECELKSEPKLGTLPDSNQTGIEWLPLEKLTAYPFYPLSLREKLQQIPVKNSSVYCGDIN